MITFFQMYAVMIALLMQLVMQNVKKFLVGLVKGLETN